ncbi:MAG: hypothetical protein ABF868_05555 [Sporolactobacillus sp.]
MTRPTAATATFGGTSIVAPQLAGLSALMNNGSAARTGFGGAQTYRFAKEADCRFHLISETGSPK